MFRIVSKKITWQGKILELETGQVARQAHGAVMVRMGGTTVLCTAVKAALQEYKGFVALTVNYQEKFYATGKIPGGFIKRETKSTERETLISRLIDRTLRPLFGTNNKNEVQIICTVLSYDEQNDSDMLALIGASTALLLANTGVSEAAAAVRIGCKENNEFYVSHSHKDVADGKLDLVLAGTKNAILMVESEIHELSTSVVLDGLKYGSEQVKSLVSFIEDFVAEYKSTSDCVCQECTTGMTIDTALPGLLRDFCAVALEEALIGEKSAKAAKVCAIEENAVAKFVTEMGYSNALIMQELAKLKKSIVEEHILRLNTRLDGRSPSELRNINCMIDYLPVVHGSALFTRGETQALVVVTIGIAQDEQTVEDLSGLKSESFLLHYNFPPFSVGEIGMLRAPGRREIGHGKLASKAIKSVVPSKADFPYTIRIVSDITESNGSSSMATVCGASLALMSTGVPIKRPVAGIAMGLVKKGEQFVVLSDITGEEDHLGGMDFKVTGTEVGLTALQMDIKMDGIDFDIMHKALMQAEDGLKTILSKIHDTIQAPRENLSASAPNVLTFHVAKDKIREVIGAGGKVIRELCSTYNVKIDINDDGKVVVAGVGSEAVSKAQEAIQGLVSVPTAGQIYEGTVTRILDFGAFVKILPNVEGLLHVSEIAEGYVENVGDFVTSGQAVKVKVVGVDRNGKIRLSIKALDEAFERDYSDSQSTGTDRKRRERSSGGGGGYAPAGGDKYKGGGNSGNGPRRNNFKGGSSNSSGGVRNTRPPHAGGSNSSEFSPGKKRFF